MPIYLIWLLIVLVVSGAAGIGFALGNLITSVLAFIGAAFVVFMLWEPLIQPAIKRIMNK